MQQRGWWVLLWSAGLLSAVGRCSPPPSGTQAQELVDVCAPLRVRAGERFEIRVLGGCVAVAEQTTCRVIKQNPRLSVALMGPAGDNCAGGHVEKPCSVPALEEGTWRVEFDRGRAFDRDLEVAGDGPGFVCPWLDGGVAGDAGALPRG